MPDTKSPRDVYATALKNAHAMTAETHTVLQRQADHAKNYPAVAQRLAQHATTVKARLPQIESAMSSFGETSSGFKDAVTSTIGAVAEIGHGLTGDTEMKDYFVAGSFAGLNHVAFRSLKTSAGLAGADAAWIDGFIGEEEQFGRWLYENVDTLTRDYTARVGRGDAAQPT